jgi:hypothetical protein
MLLRSLRLHYNRHKILSSPLLISCGQHPSDFSGGQACRRVEVIHILNPGKTEPHRLHSAARLAGGKLIYDRGEQGRLL